ncbi:mycofactocin biosynthesis peptidyl-dipeptidase MftE [Mycolicibacterium goodii]|uniref:Mycofactocin biosynthesis peptidyl-dipeptidase MftE n=1 Tax=Mycolicibacterium goodii TaxID=134601 RepID=A0ABS6HTJ7_MYCGD|nr:mycofactocin biosynthesis peptidyl-dipeptidase MftE [Mycolicibacterium goodii]MBU8809427.1 mycofactocin biosynthesis peptidyl-dipeptidase MftE [Mycolicibacterium goodii]MBU8825528.1 mycofactocin biosynthesis peptidyl-dipeptidase MftE [Mycolicibacterium goodii]MBU8838674.1 mycofactocin biosynthesis peptidyl-dipeptidase MftE [Mycolicibacterium goodii]PJK22126.1 mycofactocin biosynthesis peptidyl-dipeptidase MftE [Mycolicibacterium goodii]ULN50702.1 mycofactocin biosynthesis peptidyl-dipeptida
MNSAYHRHVASRSGLGNSTTRQLQRMVPMLLVPVGSTEQHGPHLPLDTDTRIATAVAGAAVEQLGAPAGRDAVVAPAVSYGASGEHEGFPGTVSIGTAALELLLVEYGRSASHWASRIVFVNGHGGNVEALSAAVGLLRYEGRDAGWVPCSVPDADPHAGHTETSVLLHISPDDVLTEEIICGITAPLTELMPRMRSGGIAAVSEVGILGDPTTATAAEGERIFAEMVNGCADRIKRWQPDRNGLLT